MPAADLRADLAALLRQHGHSQVDFTVVGSGPNGVNPHHEAGERTIREGDMVGEPTDEERFGVRIEDIVVATEDGGRRLNNTHREMRVIT